MFRFAAMTAALALCAATAVRADYTVWKIERGWDISYYSEQIGCMASRQFDDGTMFFIGYDYSIEVPSLDVILMNENWASLVPDQDYDVQLFFGDETPWDVPMSAHDFGGVMGLAAYQDAKGAQADLFRLEFKRESGMEWVYNGRTLGTYSLKGSTWAMNEVEACQKSWLDKGVRDDLFGDAKDPFASPVDPARADPFYVEPTVAAADQTDV